MVFKKNPIEEYFKDQKNNAQGDEVFKANEGDVDIKTELSDDSIVQITTLYETDKYLYETLGIKPIFLSYYEKYMRLMISRNRKSREEYVEINKAKKEDNIEQLNSLFKR